MLSFAFACGTLFFLWYLIIGGVHNLFVNLLEFIKCFEKKRRNIRSLLAKLMELTFLLESLQINLVCVQESWLDASVPHPAQQSGLPLLSHQHSVWIYVHSIRSCPRILALWTIIGCINGAVQQYLPRVRCERFCEAP